MLRLFRVMMLTFGIVASAAAPLISLVPEAEARAACGPRGCAAAGCGAHRCGAAAVGRPGYHPGPVYRPAPVYRHPVYRPPGVVVVNPRRYWAPGGAVAAGAAIGFIAGAAAVSVAGAAPKPGYCWYYTNPQKTTGFWDVCP